MLPLFIYAALPPIAILTGKPIGKKAPDRGLSFFVEMPIQGPVAVLQEFGVLGKVNHVNAPLEFPGKFLLNPVGAANLLPELWHPRPESTKAAIHHRGLRDQNRGEPAAPRAGCALHLNKQPGVLPTEPLGFRRVDP